MDIYSKETKHTSYEKAARTPHENTPYLMLEYRRMNEERHEVYTEITIKKIWSKTQKHWKHCTQFSGSKIK
jgi:hypothetical protein